MNLIREDYLKLIRPYYDVDLIKLVSKPETLWNFSISS